METLISVYKRWRIGSVGEVGRDSVDTRAKTVDKVGVGPNEGS